MAPVAVSPPPASSPAPGSKQAASAAATSSEALPAVPLIDLYSGTGPSPQASDEMLRRDIIKGLRGFETFIIPGDTSNEEDKKWAYRRTLPTTILYSEQGLQIYDKLVEEDEYYLWSAESSILAKHAPEIARRMLGHQTEATSELCLPMSQAPTGGITQRVGKSDDAQGEQDEAPKNEQPPRLNGQAKVDAVRQRWEDNNGGVNQEEGLNGKRAVGPATVVELGAGSLRKTIHLVRALGQVPPAKEGEPACRYFALDLDKAELERTLKELKQQESKAADQGKWSVMDGKVHIGGMWATYDQGLAYVGAGKMAPGDGIEEGRRCLLWLGSSIGNFHRRGAAEFLQGVAKSSLRAGDTMVIGIDRRNAPERVAAAYHDKHGVTTAFIMEGLTHAARIVGADMGKWEYHDRYNAVEGRHESYYRSLADQELRFPGEAEPILIEAGELVKVEESYKSDEPEVLDMFDHAGLRVVQRWTSDNDPSVKYDIWLVQKTPFHFPSTRFLTGSRQDIGFGLSMEEANARRGSHEYDSDAHSGANALKQPCVNPAWGLPSLEQWREHWAAWDTVTLSMIPQDMLHVKPIDLRHICLFYLGHIPAFSDIILCRATKEAHLNERFCKIFERGIDANVDDPNVVVHSHSEVPTRREDWPTLEELISYKAEVIKRFDSVYAEIFAGKRELTRRLARALWMALEHVAMHMETLLYMLVQHPRTQPPAGFIAPDWASLKRDWDAAHEAQGGREALEQQINFKAAMVTLGHDDDDLEDEAIRANKPTAANGSVAELNRQLQNPEFGWDCEHPARVERTEAFSISAAPISNEQFAEFLAATGKEDRPASWVLDPRVAASKAGAADPLKDYMVRTVYGPVDMSVARHWPVQTSGALLADYAAWKGGRLPTEAELRRFMQSVDVVDRPGSNVGLRNWHPVPPQLRREDGISVVPGHNGGLFEWTSTILDKHDGWHESALYPGYSSDFHRPNDHLVLLGGSWASSPLYAGRGSAINFFYARYPFTFATARVVFDAKTRTKARTASFVRH